MQTYPFNSAGPSDPPSLVCALHRHALESILGFFSLPELPELMGVCSAFRSAVGSMAPLLDWTSLDPSSDVVSICKSPLIMHIGSLTLKGSSPRSLALLASKAVNLRTLYLRQPENHGDECLWELPTKLAYLDLVMQHASFALINDVLTAVGRLSSLDELELALPSLTQVDMAPLTQLASLHTLRIMIQPLAEDADFPDVSAEFTPQQRDALRCLSRSLTALSVDPGLTEASVRELFAAGHSFQLTNLGYSVFPLSLTADLGDLIASLPLEQLIVRPLVALDYFPRLAPTLSSLQIQLGDCTAEPDTIAASLCCLAGLTCLRITNSTLTSAHLATMMCGLPHLRELTLARMSQLQSLAFLAEAAAPKITLLSLHNCSHEHFSPLELQHLYQSQPRLASLSLIDTFNAPLDASCRSLFEPPSIVFPLLAEFDYSFDELDQNEAEAAQAGEQHAHQHDDDEEQQ